MNSNQVLHLKEIKKTYGKKEVLQGVSFQVNEGDIIGLLGPNGAGKSTITKIISGTEQASGGSIYSYGEDISKNSKNFKKYLGVVPQDIALYEDLSAYDNAKFFGSLYGYHGIELKKRVQEVLNFVGLWERREEKPSKFSGGMKRRLNIACSALHSPELLIMDEPTVGIDPQSRNHIMQMVRVLQARGTKVIYISHYIEEIEELCNRVIIMDNGTILVDQSKEDLKEQFKEEGLTNLEDIFLKLTGTELRDEVE